MLSWAAPAQPEVADLPEEKLFPLSLSAADGMLFFVVAGAQTEYVEMPDGSMYVRKPQWAGEAQDANPQYEGIREQTLPSGEKHNLRFPTNYRAVLDYCESLGEPKSLDSGFSSPVLLRASPSVLLEIMRRIGSRSDLKIGDTYSLNRSRLLRDLLFGATFTLTKNDLQDLRRNSQDPSPTPVEFNIQIPTTSVFPGWKGELLQFFYKTERTIQLDELTFDIRSRKMTFDSNLDLIEFEIVADQAFLRGPIHDIGEVFRGIDWRAWDKYPVLLSGIVRGIRLKFNIKLERNEDEGFQAFWSMDSQVPSSFEISFDDKVPRVDMYLRKQELWSNKWVEGNEPVDLETGTRPAIEGRLRSMVLSGLGGRFLQDSLSWEIERSLESGKAQANYRIDLQHLKILPTGSELALRLNYQTRGRASCLDREADLPNSVASLDARPENSFFTRDRNESLPWALSWRAANSQWELPLALGADSSDKMRKPVAELIFPLEVINVALYEMWWSGAFCKSSVDLPRDIHNRVPLVLPVIHIAPQTPPLLEIVDDDHLSLKLLLEIMEEKEGFSSESQKEKKILFENVEVELLLEKNLAGQELFLKDILIGWAAMSEKEKSFVREFLETTLTSIGVNLSWKSGNLSAVSVVEPEFLHLENFLPLSIKSLTNLSWDNTNQFFIGLELNSQAFESIDQELPAPSEIKLRTRFLKPTPTIVRDQDFIEIRWDQEEAVTERIFYSYRLAHGEANQLKWSNWSGFRESRSTKFNLERPGSYVFEIRSRSVSGVEETVLDKEEHEGEYPRLHFSYEPSADKIERKDIGLRTRFVNRLPYLVTSNEVHIAWEQSFPQMSEVRYQYRLRPPTSSMAGPVWSDWSEMALTSSVDLQLDTEGLYIFEVRSENDSTMETPALQEADSAVYQRMAFYHIGLPDRISPILTGDVEHDDSELPRLRTRILGPDDYLLRKPLVKIQWEQVFEQAANVFYSYRYRYPSRDVKSEFSWTEWTAFDPRTSTEVFLESEGLYIFEIRSADSLHRFETPKRGSQENPEYERIRFYYRPEIKVEALRDLSEWEKPVQSPESTSSSDAKASTETRQVNRMNAKGPFGCSLSAKLDERASRASGPLAILISLGLLWLLGLRRKLKPG
ncbi:MAG: hypothetical protein COV44_05790 [Deltaproteobacteria bacterium CG11_big_fil_rev_8_21_14_0_20_45_16]|nr:MAG: hypothetical protein COV44_05790 [Deltaproteobacteria bacterium CG11_big_fil_rev_8_21_14_0_20_45_16]